MKNVASRILPHFITAIALAVTVLTLLLYTSNNRTYRQMSEATYLMRGWPEELVQLILQDAEAGTNSSLPCPARVERVHPGKHGTYVTSAIITKAHTSSDSPAATCADSPNYLIQLAVGPENQPPLYEATLISKARTNQGQPPVRTRAHPQPLTITKLTDLEDLL